MSSVSIAGRTTPVAAFETTTRYGPWDASSAIGLLVGDVAAHEDDLGAGRAQLFGRGLGGLVVPHVPEHGLRRAVGDEPVRDCLADPARSSRHEDGVAHARGSGASAGAELGSSLQPGRVFGSRWLSVAFDEA